METHHGQECGEHLMGTQSCGLNTNPPALERLSENAMDNTPLYNSRIIKNYVEYLKVNYPDIDITPLLKYADIKSYQLDDEGHWLTQKQVDRFHEVLASKTDNSDIAKEVGRFAVTSQASGAVRQYLLGFLTPTTAYAVLEKIANDETRINTAVRVKSIFFRIFLKSP